MAETDARTDEQLMHAAAAGDLAAFDLLVRRYERRILAYAWRMLGDAELARDIYQQTFLNIFEHREQYRETARFSTYAYTIAGNLCRNELRRARHRMTRSLDRPTASEDDEAEPESWLADTVSEPSEPLSRDEEDRLLHEAIDALDPIYREVVALRCFEGLPFKQIADIAGANESTIKSRMRYALGHLERALHGKLGRDE